MNTDNTTIEKLFVIHNLIKKGNDAVFIQTTKDRKEI